MGNMCCSRDETRKNNNGKIDYLGTTTLDESKTHEPSKLKHNRSRSSTGAVSIASPSSPDVFRSPSQSLSAMTPTGKPTRHGTVPFVLSTPAPQRTPGDGRPRNPDGTIDHFSPIRRQSAVPTHRSPQIKKEIEQEKFLREQISPISDKISQLQETFQRDGELSVEDVLEMSVLLKETNSTIESSTLMFTSDFEDSRHNTSSLRERKSRSIFFDNSVLEAEDGHNSAMNQTLELDFDQSYHDNRHTAL